MNNPIKISRNKKPNKHKNSNFLFFLSFIHQKLKFSLDPKIRVDQFNPLFLNSMCKLQIQMAHKLINNTNSQTQIHFLRFHSPFGRKWKNRSLITWIWKQEKKSATHNTWTDTKTNLEWTVNDCYEIVLIFVILDSSDEGYEVFVGSETTWWWRSVGTEDGRSSSPLWKREYGGGEGSTVVVIV